MPLGVGLPPGLGLLLVGLGVGVPDGVADGVGAPDGDAGVGAEPEGVLDGAGLPDGLGVSDGDVPEGDDGL